MGIIVSDSVGTLNLHGLWPLTLTTNIKFTTRLGVNKVKPEGWFKFFL